MTDAIFICETCGKVYPDTCPTCPDRGNGRGVTVEKIKQDILACPTIGDVNHTAQHYRGHVKALEAASREARAMAIQIKNLAWYRRTELRTRY